MSGFLLETSGLVKIFKGFMAVPQADLKVRRGLFQALIRLNGSGETTVFNIVTKFSGSTITENEFNSCYPVAHRHVKAGRRNGGSALSDASLSKHPGACGERRGHLASSSRYQKEKAWQLSWTGVRWRFRSNESLS